MKITADQVRYVAHLSRLKLSPEEEALFTKHLNAILDYMDKLNELDTSGVEPTFHVVPHVNAFREDRPQRGAEREEILSNAPRSRDGFFLVPRVI